MAAKRVLLSINPEVFSVLEQKAKSHLMTVQEFIMDAVRKSLIVQPERKSKAGRPVKVDDPYLEYFSRKR